MFELHIPRWLPLQKRSKSLSSEAIGWIALAVMIITSSTYNSFAKQLTGALSSLSLLVLSEALTAFFVLLAFGVVPTARRLCSMKRRAILPLVILGLLNGVLAPLLFFIGLKETTAVNAELFGRMEMVALLVLAVLILREEHFTRTHLIAGSVMLFGIVFVALKGLTESFNLHGGDALILLSTLIFAVGSIIYKKYLHALSPELVIVSRALVAIGAFFLLSPFIEHPFIAELRAFPVMLIPALLGFGFISRFLNLFSFYESIDRIPVSYVSFFSTANIICGVFFAFLYLHEAIHWYDLIGGAFIVLGALLLEILGVHPSDAELREHMSHRHKA